jgi:uncharacterized membrane protein YcaP (DUF421 family)
MWRDLFDLTLPTGEKVLRTVLVYALILVLFRLTGKRDLASLNTMDFVVMFLLSNVVQNAIIGDDNTFLGGAIGAFTLILVNYLVDRLAWAFPKLRWLLEGNATTIVRDGKVQGKALRALGIRRAELDHAVRMQNGNDISDVWSGSLEPSGQLLLTLKTQKQSSDHGDIAALKAQLDRIELLLRQR